MAVDPVTHGSLQEPNPTRSNYPLICCGEFICSPMTISVPTLASARRILRGLALRFPAAPLSQLYRPSIVGKRRRRPRERVVRLARFPVLRSSLAELPDHVAPCK